MSGMSRRALARRRCLIPADAFYEWQTVEGGKKPYAIARQDGEPQLRHHDRGTECRNGEMEELHDRMPVILEEQDWSVWLGEAEGDSTALLRPAPDGLLRVWPVDRRVGLPRNNGPDLLESIAA
jgi:putative SOS response-associated peptidase YedK